MQQSSPRRRACTISDVLERWPSLACIAEDLSLPDSTVRSWLARRYIPSLHFAALIASATKRDVGGVSIRLLRELEAERLTERSVNARDRRNRRYNGSPPSRLL